MYEIRRPRASLAPYVESVWVQEDLTNAASESYPPTRVIPRGAVELIFHYRDRFAHVGEGRTELEPTFYLSGQKTRPIEVSATGQTGLIIVNFYPWGAAPFFRFPMDELTDTALPLDLVLNSNAVECSLHEAEDTTARVEIIQDFLEDVLDEERRDELILQSVLEIHRCHGNVSIEALAADATLSRRQFLRRFGRSVGMSPKAFANVVRFQKASYYRRRGVAWSEITYRCGYHDQAHFIHELCRFSGLPARDFSAARPLTGLGQHFSRGRTPSHFYNTTYL